MVKDFLLRTKSPILAYVLNDLRLASKNPSLAFLYAAPIFEMLTLAVITVQFPIMRATAMIISTVVGCFFSTMICSTFLNTEGVGLEHSMSLPLKMKTTINAKGLIAALTFVPVPIALLAIALSKQVVSNYVLAIPFVELIAVFAACTGEIAFFLRPESRENSLRKSRGFSMMSGSDIARLSKSIAVAFTILLIPIIAYAVAYLGTFSHALSILSMLSCAVVELCLMLGSLVRLLH